MFNHKLSSKTDNLKFASLPFPKGSAIFAPMEGVTNATYRRIIRNLYPAWDALCADFIRIPSNGIYPLKYLIKHIGTHVLENPAELQRTMVQILTSPAGKTFETISQLMDLGVHWLDLNIGCPSGTVVKHGGGSSWLKKPQELISLVGKIREMHPHFFTVKMRLGFDTPEHFLSLVKSFENIGVDALIIHARTREQMYSTPADWNYFKIAADEATIPIIANGDIWTLEDKERVLSETKCHSVMIARGALKCPWLPQVCHFPTDKKYQIQKYFQALIQTWHDEEMVESTIVKKIKELSRYLYEDVTEGEQIKRAILLSKNLTEQQGYIYAE